MVFFRNKYKRAFKDSQREMEELQQIADHQSKKLEKLMNFKKAAEEKLAKKDILIKRLSDREEDWKYTLESMEKAHKKIIKKLHSNFMMELKKSQKYLQTQKQKEGTLLKIINDKNGQLKALKGELALTKETKFTIDLKYKELLSQYEEKIESLKNVTESRNELEEKYKQLEEYNKKCEEIEVMEKRLAKAKDEDEALRKKTEEDTQKRKKIWKLKRKTLKEAIKLNYRATKIDNLKKKLSKIENAVRVFKVKCTELKAANNSFTDEIEGKNAELETVITSEKKAMEKFNQAQDILKQLAHKLDKEIKASVIEKCQEENLDQLKEALYSKIDLSDKKILEQKVEIEYLHTKCVTVEHKNKELQDKLIQQDEIVENIKKQTDTDLKLLYKEITKSEAGLDMLLQDGVPSIGFILRQIRTRNVIMKEMRDEKDEKETALMRVEGNCARIRDREKRIAEAVRDAKGEYLELEKENRILREALERKHSKENAKKTRRHSTKTRVKVTTFGERDMLGQESGPSQPATHTPLLLQQNPNSIVTLDIKHTTQDKAEPISEEQKNRAQKKEK